MYLKNIELIGFKSFASKIILSFEKGITGIVGPNGSGKSNISDAVRWVLGEQSAKQLRGSKMEDVIFAGTETRRQLGYCQVSLTIDNSDKKLAIDYSEVTVARRVYRSGESDYSINGSSCRLKDIHELFFDTGIGKEGYSIIGQGQIEKILSSKPEDRRDLFDEAAGIVKYKKRKEIAEKKLEEENQNLTRVNDILSEIENQIEPLKEQSEVAKQYLQHKEKLKELEINIFLQETTKVKERLKNIEENEQIAGNDLKITQCSLAATKEKHDTLEKEIEEMALKVDALKEEIINSNLENEKLENQIKLTSEQINAIITNNNHLKERLSIVEKQLKEYSIEEDNYRAKKLSLNEQIKNRKEDFKKLQEELKTITERIETYVKKIEENKAMIIEGLNSISSSNNKYQRYKTMKEQINIRKSELHKKILLAQSSENGLSEEQKIVNDKYEILLKDINMISSKKEEHENVLKKLQNDKNKVTNVIEQQQRLYHQNQSKYDALKDINEQYEGYNFSIKKIMEYKKKNEKISQRILGVVADVINVKKEYETAIEIALGGNIQNIITDNDDTAKHLVQYLKTNQYGRATFFPITSVKANNDYANHEVLKEKGVIGVANKLIDFDKQFADLMCYLLGRVIVVDDIDNAINIARKYKNSLRIVTLGGELLSPGGSITGGSFKKNHHLLGRKRELELLESDLESIKNKLQEYQLSNAEIDKEKEKYLSEYEKIKADIQKYNLEQNTYRMTINQIEEKIKNNSELKSDIETEINELNNQFIEVTEQIKILTEEKNRLEISNKEYEKNIEEINSIISDDKTLYNDIQEKTTKYQIEISSLEQELNYVLENLKRIIKDNNSLNEENENLNSTLEKNEKEINRKNEYISNVKDQIDEIKVKTEITKNELNEKTNIKEQKTKSLKSYFNEREEISEKLSLLDKEIYRLSTQKEKLNEQINQLTDYMWSEYEITYNQALGYLSDDNISLSAMNKEVSSLKHQIRNLGSVNVNAIEDYKNITERFTFLQTQKEDLLLAEEKLIQIIVELDEAMRIQFEQKFKEINEKFNEVFLDLFGGGKAVLELMEDEDILQAGIKIIAQPPGKKLQNMMLLSGGERAFTAIALLFAFQSLKPSPFCVLDEIEAALDDANVYRFAHYLHKLSNETQFIVITHRKGTMESADALYGITMQEKGVSTLVSVKLIENELEG